MINYFKPFCLSPMGDGLTTQKFSMSKKPSKRRLARDCTVFICGCASDGAEKRPHFLVDLLLSKAAVGRVG